MSRHTKHFILHYEYIIFGTNFVPYKKSKLLAFPRAIDIRTLLVLQEYKICFIKKETDHRITESGYHKEVKKLSRVSFDGISRSEIYNGILYFKREVKVC